MRLRLLVTLAPVLLLACHGIEHPTSPVTPAPVSMTPATMTVTATPGELPIGGGDAVFSIAVMNQAGSGVPDATVALSASEGALSAQSARTDRSGYALVQWSGRKTGVLTASIGDLVATGTIPVNTTASLPPPSTPPPPAPRPTPEPLPPTPPSLTVAMTATPLQVAMATPVTLDAAVQNLNPGESVTAYQWIWEGTGTTIDETSVSSSRAHIYATDGVRAPKVSVITSSGRTATGTGRVIVFKP